VEDVGIGAVLWASAALLTARPVRVATSPRRAILIVQRNIASLTGVICDCNVCSPAKIPPVRARQAKPPYPFVYVFAGGTR